MDVSHLKSAPGCQVQRALFRGGVEVEVGGRGGAQAVCTERGPAVGQNVCVVEMDVRKARTTRSGSEQHNASSVPGAEF